MSFAYKITESDKGGIVIVVIDGEIFSADDTHPNYEEICEAARAGDPDVVDLFDMSIAVAKELTPLSERVAVANGQVYFDGDVVDNALTQHIVRVLDAGKGGWTALVRFMEKVYTNPSEHSRENLYRWLVADDFTIDVDGDIIGYKGVRANTDGGYRSLTAGTATVNGIVHTGYIPQEIGDVVEMPRSAVEFDPAAACSVGLHVGTWGYASDFSCGPVLQVAVNPRDVVSVPTDCNGQKMRVCRYRVVNEISERLNVPVEETVKRPTDNNFAKQKRDARGRFVRS